MKLAKEISIIFFFLSFGTLACVMAMNVRPFDFTVLTKQATATLADIQQTSAEVRKTVDDAKASWDDNYYTNKAMNETAAVTARQISEVIRKTDIELFGGKRDSGEPVHGTFEDIHTTLAVAQAFTDGMTKDVLNVSDSARKSLEPLAKVVVDIDGTILRLNQQIDAQSPDLHLTVEHINQDLVDLDKLIADPHLSSTIAHVDGTMETVDIALRPWRKRAGLLKTILLHAVDLVKFTVPVHN